MNPRAGDVGDIVGAQLGEPQPPDVDPHHRRRARGPHPHEASTACPICDTVIQVRVEVQVLEPVEGATEAVLDARVVAMTGCAHTATFDPEAF